MTQERNTKDGGQSCWKTARERERLRARFDIRQRVANGLLVTPYQQSDHDETYFDTETANKFLRHALDGSVSSFSLTSLDKHATLITMPLPSSMLPVNKVKTLCTSRYGEEHAGNVLAFCNARANFTLMEFAALIGEYRVVGALLVGGIDPTLSGSFIGEKVQRNVSKDLTLQILRRFFDCFPTSLKTYIVKRVVDMRLQGWIEGCKDLCFGDPCLHSFPEEKLWSDLYVNLDKREHGDVVCCPICGERPSSSKVVERSEDYSTPERRRAQSLEKFLLLPDTSNDLKAISKKKAPKKPCIASSWSDALVCSVGNSKDVRIDKFFTSTECGSIHLVRSCLESGVDVNMTNEYGQTALFLAAWKGSIAIVNLLLEFDANPFVTANGGSTALAVAIANGHAGVSAMFGVHDAYQTIQYPPSQLEPWEWPGAKVKVLIPFDANHPGAGSFIIDNALPERYLNALVELKSTLPLARSDKKKKKNVELCSNRFYFSDSHGWVRHLLEVTISRNWSKAVVLPHMRFLDYERPGSALAPHVDLCRVDSETGRRSTHTFILYLHTCESGGETVLLESLSSKVELAAVAPVRGRLLAFPHICPHMGAVVNHVPKLLLRGEIILCTSQHQEFPSCDSQPSASFE